MKKRIGLNQSKVVDLIGLLVRAPRTVAELSELTSVSRYGIYPWLKLMTEEGLLRKEAHPRGPKGGRVFKYYWNK